MNDNGIPWIWTQSDNIKKLVDRALDFEYKYFQDMVFSPESSTGRLTAVKYINADGTEMDDYMCPEELQDFDLMAMGYKFQIKDLDEVTMGQYDFKNKTITIDPKYEDNDSVLLHEMIHLHEGVLEKYPLYYHDAILYTLLGEIKEKVTDLDDLIMAHIQIFNEYEIDKSGGTHDLLFFLKSLQIDLDQGYKLGTVFGYGYDES